MKQASTKRHQTLMSFVSRNDLAGFRAYIRQTERCSISLQDEQMFFEIATPTWLKVFLARHWPSISAERFLLTEADPKVMFFSAQVWGLYSENIDWVFEEGSLEACYRLIDLAKQMYLDSDMERRVICRADLGLFEYWLLNFPTLQEDSERLLHESAAYDQLKRAYIEHNIRQF